MAFSKRKKRKRIKASSKSRIQEIRSPYAHRKSLNKKLPRKAKKSKYSSELKMSYRKSFPLKKFLFIGVGILALIIIIYTTIFTNFFQIKNWKVYGDDIILENSKFEEFISIHKGKNLALLDTGKIAKTIKEQYPEIQNLKVKKVFPSTVVLEYANFPEVANLFNLVEDTQKKFVVNEIGYLVEEDFENPNLPYIKMRTDKALEINEYGISHEKLDYILDAIYDYEELFGMKVLDAEYMSKEREVHLKTERDFEIWLDMSLSLQEQYSKLKKTMNKLNIYTESLEYIDLRISSINGQRVIFKRR